VEPAERVTADPLALPHGLAASAIARRHVEAAGAEWHQEVRGVALLLTSELVTNAVVHGSAPVSLLLRHGPGRVRIEVSDTGSDLPARPDPQLTATGESGRGLQLVDALASDWGSEPHPTGPGKITWFELELHDGQPPRT
jgi:anti-sigma regulatory factor (Ser/Thr protein kinase)